MFLVSKTKFLYTTPEAALDVLTEPELMYLHLLFALKDRALGTIEANFANLVYTGSSHKVS